MVSKTIFQGNPAEVSEELIKSVFGSHFAIIYPDLPTLREMYSQYIKSVLSSANINVRKYEKEQLLLIVDSLKGYFGSPGGLMPFLSQTVEYASKLGKNGLSVLGDMGSFFYYNKKDGLLDYEITLSSKYKDMNYMKGFCMYNGHDFDKRFNEEERQRLLVHHVKTLKLLQP